MPLYEVLDERGLITDVLNSSVSCNPREPTDRCGGCDECLLMQCHHWGTKTRLMSVAHEKAWRQNGLNQAWAAMARLTEALE